MKTWYLVDTSMVGLPADRMSYGQPMVLKVIHSDTKPDVKEEMRKLGYSEPSFRNAHCWTKDGEYDVPFYAPEIRQDMREALSEASYEYAKANPIT